MTTMKYGSQTDTVSHYMDTVHIPLPLSPVSCESLATAPPATVTEKSRVQIGELVVHRVSHIEGTSSSNLLGFARPHVKKNRDGASVLDKLLDSTQTWSAVMYPAGGWLALGALPCYRAHYIPLLSPRAFTNFLTRFYIVNVLSIAVGPSMDVLTPLAYVPRYCLIDTGTTGTYGSPKLGTALDASGYTTQSVVQLKLGSAMSPLTLSYTAWPGRTLDDYTQLFPDAEGGVLLLGAVMMFGFYWEFDLSQDRVGVQDLRV
jgi:hypothetical protein